MLIGEISKKANLSRDTIRFYEKKELIKVHRTDSEWNNYKNYTEETLQKLLMIKRIKSFGFTLKETSEILDMIGLGMANCSVISKKVNEKIDSINQKIKELEKVKEMIYDRVDTVKWECKSKVNGENCQVLTET